jgi:putative flippase GtrA
LSELPQYFLVSCCGLAVDGAVLLVLNRQFGVPYLLAATISFILGGVVGYQLSIRFVWDSGNSRSNSYELALFLLLGIVGLGVNVAVMLVMISRLHAPLLMGKATAAGCTFICNYLMRRRLVFPNAPRRVLSWTQIIQ